MNKNELLKTVHLFIASDNEHSNIYLSFDNVTYGFIVDFSSSLLLSNEVESVTAYKDHYPLTDYRLFTRRKIKDE